MLRPYGEVHVSHKTAVPFSHWNLEELAAENSLLLIECANFCIDDYPGYSNKRGDGSRSDKPFPLGKCSTFKFIIGNPHKKKNPLRNTDLPLPSSSISPMMVNHQISYGNISDISYPQTPFPMMVNNQISYGKITDISYPQTPFPVNFDERIPRSINGLAFGESTLPPMCRINDPRLMIHDLQFSTFSRPPLPSSVSLSIRYYTGVPEAPRSASLGYCNYSRYYDEVNSRRVSILECSRVLEREGKWDEETRRRWLYLCKGMRA